MRVEESPEVLIGGRWVNDRGIQRWVQEVEHQPGAVLFEGRCVECNVAVDKPYCQGKCRRCYDSRYRKTDIRRRPSIETVAEWHELKAHGLSVREGAAAMGISLSALYAAIKRANRRERGSERRAAA